MAWWRWDPCVYNWPRRGYITYKYDWWTCCDTWSTCRACKYTYKLARWIIDAMKFRLGSVFSIWLRMIHLNVFCSVSKSQFGSVWFICPLPVIIPDHMVNRWMKEVQVQVRFWQVLYTITVELYLSVTGHLGKGKSRYIHKSALNTTNLKILILW